MHIFNLVKKFFLIKVGRVCVTATLQFCCTMALLLSSIVILGLSRDASAATIQLPQTGQTKCYTAAGALTDCAGTGQDADQKVGVSLPSPRFTVYDTACMIDNLTGLMWVKAPAYTSRSWNASIDYANGLDLCGYTDWRLPNINELLSLVNLNEVNPAAWLITQGFSGIHGADYEVYSSSSTYAPSAGNAWTVYMGIGNMSTYTKSYGNYAWPVRGGQ